MEGLLKLSRAIDAVNFRIGKVLSWLILIVVIISAANATVRKVFDMSSNAWLELQWVLFGAIFLLCSPWTLLSNEHIRIDIVNNMLPKRWRDGIDVFGHVFFLLPLTIVMIITSVPFFLRSFQLNEQSMNAGGLPQWPAKFLILIGLRTAVLPGHFRAHQAHCGDARSHSRSLCCRRNALRCRGGGRTHSCRGQTRWPIAIRARRRSDDHVGDAHPLHGADHVRVAGDISSARLSGCILACRQRPHLRPDRHRARIVPPRFPAGVARAHLRDHEQRRSARHSVLHLHGADSRTIRHGGGPARHHRSAVRNDPRRARLCGDLRRRAAGRNHRRGRGVGDLDGTYLAADHAALRLRSASGVGRHRRFRHAGADHSAVAGADRDGRPARHARSATCTRAPSSPA